MRLAADILTEILAACVKSDLAGAMGVIDDVLRGQAELDAQLVEGFARSTVVSKGERNKLLKAAAKIRAGVRTVTGSEGSK